MRSSSKSERGTRFGGTNRTDGHVKVGSQNANADGPWRGRVTNTGLYNYHALAGCGSDTFRALNEGRGWRAALLGTVATGALWLMAPRPAKAGPATCTYSNGGATVTCTGDQSAGITSAAGGDFDPATVDTLNVNSLTTDVGGIWFRRYGASDTVTINSDIAPHSISVSGQPGINASGFGGVTINNTGDIAATDSGINATSLNGGAGGAVTVINNGAITSVGFNGIFAAGDAGVTVQQTGDITSPLGSSIEAKSSNGPVRVINIGNLTSRLGEGIYAKSDTSTVYVSNNGNINITAGPGPGAPNTIYASGALDVTVRNTGNITNAHKGGGIFAHSTGGAVNVISSGTITADHDVIYARGAQDVTVQHTGDILMATNAGTGRGIFAYSTVGGAVSVSIDGNISAYSDGIFAVSKGITGPPNVAVTSTGDITSTHGSGIHAYTKSGTTLSVTSSGTIRAYGDGIYARNNNSAFGAGASVTVTQTGDITSTNGRGIYAGMPVGTGGSIVITSSGNITAQGNGIDARSTNNSSVVTVTHTGDITSTGADGIYAKALGSINITVDGGTISGAAAGIQIAFGASNITIGSGAIVTGGTDAILGGLGNDTVNNSGTVTGDVNLGGSVNAFNNLAGGIFNSGATVNLGPGNTFTNSGTLAPGGTGTVQTTALTGNFVQNAGGKFAVDVNVTGVTADRLNVSGTAQLAGTVVPHFLNLSATPQTFTILSATGGATDNGLTVQDTAVMTYQLTFPNPTDVELAVLGVNFAPSGLTPNEQAVGQHLQQAFLAGGGDLSNLLTELAELDFATFAGDLDHLTPEPYLGQSQAALWSGFDFANSLFSCPLPSSQASLMGEGSCYWLRPSGHVATLGGHDGYMSFNESAAGLTGGVQGELAPNWYLDVGAGYERSTIDTDASSANGNVFHGGAALKYIRNNLLVAGSVSGSFARYDTSRYDIPTAGTATANADTDTLDLRLRLAYAFGTPAFYVKPMVDFDAVGLWRGAIDESGAGALDLHVQSETDWLASAAPAVEFGTQWQQGGYTWRPYVRAGVRFLSEDDFSATARFEGSPAGIAPFTVTSPLDQTLAEISAGFNVWQAKRLSVEVSYDGRFGAHDSENGGAVKLRAAF